MSSSRKQRILILLSAVTFLAGAGLASAAPASAAPNFTFKKGSVSSDGSFRIAVYADGVYAGDADWNADPLDIYDTPGADIPGDAMQARDLYADGWGVEAILQSPYRVASTAGHDSPYTTKWMTGDIKEGTTVKMRICMVQGGNADCSDYYSGHA